MKHPHRAIDTKAGLIRIALAQGDTARALALTEEILCYLAEHSIEGILSPFGTYLACIQALQAANDHRADVVLAEAKGILMKTAVMIENQTLKDSYLQNVPAHRALMTM